MPSKCLAVKVVLRSLIPESLASTKALVAAKAGEYKSASSLPSLISPLL